MPDVEDSKRYVALYCFNLTDGTGDFGHGVDIYQALKEQDLLKDYEILYINVIDNRKIDRLLPTLRNHFGDNPNIHVIRYDIGDIPMQRIRDYSEKIQEKLKKVEIIFSASSDFLVRKTLLDFIQKPHVTVFLREHFSSTKFDAYKTNINLRTMGLLNKNCGVLVRDLKSLNTDQKTDLIKKLNNEQFGEKLFTKSISEIDGTYLSTWLDNNLIIPGYLHLGQKPFIMSIATNSSIKHKNIIFYLNGFESVDKDAEIIKEISEYLLKNGVDIVEFDIGGSTMIFKEKDIKSSTLKTVSILSGYNLSDNDFDILYSLASLLAAAGGDKTAEKAISHHLLIWYSLNKIEPKLENDFINIAAAEIPAAENVLVKYLTLVNKITKCNDPMSIIKELSEIDLYKVFEQWKKVEFVIFKNYNLFDKIPKIVLESLFYSAVLRNDINFVNKNIEEIENLDLRDNENNTFIMNAYIRKSTELFNVLMNEQLRRLPNLAATLDKIVEIYQNLIATSHDDKLQKDSQLYYFGEILQTKYLNLIRDSLNNPELKIYYSNVNEIHLKFIFTEMHQPNSFFHDSKKSTSKEIVSCIDKIFEFKAEIYEATLK